MAKQLPDAGLDVRMLGPDGQFEPVDYVQASAGAAEGNYVTFLVPDIRKLPTAANFVKAFDAKYGSISSYGPLAYEATNILLGAIQKAGKEDRAAIRDAVRATKGAVGILGQPVTFNEKGDIDAQNVYIYQVKGADFVQLQAITLSQN
jgi:branched-chain amino acid transport system substrate-binding protein